MGQFADEIPDNLIPWIRKQEIFFVATAPLSSDGHVNVSPKGVCGSFTVESKTQVWYEDLSGSGVETIAHLKENKRITIMFCALEGAARIVRLFGIGTVHEFGTPEYEHFVPPEKRLSGSRAAIVVDVHKVGSSCGYAVPLYKFQAHRTALFNWSEKMEARDASVAPSSTPSSSPSSLFPPSDLKRVYPERSMTWWWVHWNLRSLDGLPALAHAHVADAVPRTGDEARARQQGVREPPSDGSVVILGNRVAKAGVWEKLVWAGRKGEAVRLVLAFSLGIVVAAVCMVVVGREARSLRWPAGVLP